MPTRVTCDHGNQLTELWLYISQGMRAFSQKQLKTAMSDIIQTNQVRAVAIIIFF